MKTQKDIARLLQLSPATVSLALRGSSSISAEVRERVLAMMRKHGVRVRQRAVAVVPAKAGTPPRLGYCSTSFEDGWLHVSAYPAMTQRGREAHHDVLMFLSVLPHGGSPQAAGEELAAQLATARLNGLIVDARAELLTQLRSISLPRVLLGFFNPEPDHEDAVVPDNFAAGYLLTHELLKQGHRRIACIRCRPTDWNSIEKYQGHCAALQQAGIVPDPGLTLAGDFTWMSGARCAEQLAARSDPPTAVMLENDWLTLQFVQGLRATAAGQRLLGKLHLAHIVDARRETGLEFELDRIELRASEMGRLAVSLLLDRMSGKLADAPLTLKVSPRFCGGGQRVSSARNR